jgi:hypothetical protein
MPQARGTFTVQLVPQSADDYADGAVMGRMTIDKQFAGDLTATSKGQMLTGMGSIKGSAAYTAVERVHGTLHGAAGSFILVHKGVMDRGAQSLDLTVAPDSGSGALAGLRGAMRIIIDGKQHSYEFDYEIRAPG